MKTVRKSRMVEKTVRIFIFIIYGHFLLSFFTSVRHIHYQVSAIDVEVSPFGHYIDQELMNLVDVKMIKKLYINGFSFAIF